MAHKLAKWVAKRWHGLSHWLCARARKVWRHADSIVAGIAVLYICYISNNFLDSNISQKSASKMPAMYTLHAHLISKPHPGGTFKAIKNCTEFFHVIRFYTGACNPDLYVAAIHQHKPISLPPGTRFAFVNAHQTDDVANDTKNI